MSPTIAERCYLEHRLYAERDAAIALPQSSAMADWLERAAWDAQSDFIDELRAAVRG